MMTDEALDLSNDLLSNSENGGSQISTKCAEQTKINFNGVENTQMLLVDQLQGLLTDRIHNQGNNQLNAVLATILSTPIMNSNNLSNNNTNLSPWWLTTKNALGSILQQLPAPSSASVVSFSALHSLYASIHATCLSLDKLLEQYFLLFLSAFLKSTVQLQSPIQSNTAAVAIANNDNDIISSKSSPNTNNVNPNSNITNLRQQHHQQNHHISLKRKSLSPITSHSSCKSQKSHNAILNTPYHYNEDINNNHLDPLHSTFHHNNNNNNNNNTNRLFKRKKNNTNNSNGHINNNTSNNNNNNNINNNNLHNSNKKSNFRGTSEAENEIDPQFQPREINREVILCEEYSAVRLDRDVYHTLTSKAPRSATRLIRLLMKHFFSQETLARSSLSGEGIYKDRLQPEVIEAIKLFIKRRHPKLKNGSINLCMTDVCVQARRVNKNQRTRIVVTAAPSSTSNDNNGLGNQHHQNNISSNNNNNNNNNVTNVSSNSVPSLIGLADITPQSRSNIEEEEEDEEEEDCDGMGMDGENGVCDVEEEFEEEEEEEEEECVDDRGVNEHLHIFSPQSSIISNTSTPQTPPLLAPVLSITTSTEG